jgi:hypothetical protein
MKRKSVASSKNADADLEIPQTPAAFFRTAVMGKYSGRGGTLINRLVELDQDVARVFRNSEEVNEALRLVVRLKQVGRTKKKSA